jgi:hypothetical protein
MVNYALGDWFATPCGPALPLSLLDFQDIGHADEICDDAHTPQLGVIKK